MANKQMNPRSSVTYFFLRAKDVHLEDGLPSITLFARLGREFSSIKAGRKRTHVETAWVQMDDLQMDHVPEKMKNLPNCVQKYELSSPVFQHLLHLSRKCPNELYGITPYYLKADREMFLSWEELDQCWQDG